MTENDRELVAAVRAELAAIDPPRACCRRAEAIGLAGGAIGRGPSSTANFRVTAENAPERTRRRSDADGPGMGRSGLARVRLRLRREDDGSNEAHRLAFDWDASPEHCRTAYLRGLFLATGSLSLAGGRSHLEFVVDPADAPALAVRLAGLDLAASWRVRRGRGVVTWKSSEKVGLFLRRVGAAAALLEIEARQVARLVNGDLNRVLNAESANLQRGVLAAARQIEAICALDADGRLAVQPYVVRLVADARRETPEATLSELAERLELHRSSVQRALERIEWLVLHPDDEAPRRRRHGRGEGALRLE